MRFSPAETLGGAVNDAARHDPAIEVGAREVSNGVKVAAPAPLGYLYDPSAMLD
jgi:hypothetical protein